MPRKSTNPGTDAVVLRRLVQVLPVQLQPDELRERGSSLARTREAAEVHEAQAKLARDELKARENELDAEMGRLARIIRDGCEYREVPVEVRLALKAGYVDEVRVDTGEVLSTRRAHDTESQGELPGLTPATLAQAAEEAS